LVDQRDISVASDGGVFIVGQESSYRFDGTEWSRTYHGGRILQDVWARNRNEAYAISNDAVLQFAGGSWQLLHQEPHAFYQDVWGTNEGEVFIASMNGIYRYFEGTFERVSPTWSVESICGTSSSDIVAASQWFFFVFDGVVWNPAESEIPGYGPDLNATPRGDIFMLRHLSTDFSDRDELFVRVR